MSRIPTLLVALMAPAPAMAATQVPAPLDRFPRKSLNVVDGKKPPGSVSEPPPQVNLDGGGAVSTLHPALS